MQITIRARYTGQAIIPDEPLELPEGQSLEVTIKCLPSGACPESVEAQRAWQELKATAIKGLKIPDEALQREQL